MSVVVHQSVTTEQQEGSRLAGAAVQAALPADFREAILVSWGPPTRHGRGHDVADVLRCLDQHDAHAGWADVAYEQYAADLLEGLHEEGDGALHYVRAFTVAYAVQALCLVEQGVPSYEAVERLVHAALAGERS